MPARDRLAIVVQRCHESVQGGSEAHAWEYVRLLRDRFDIDVLTSTALDYVTWKEELPAGLDHREGIPVRRFRIAAERSAYWHDLNRQLRADHAELSKAGRPLCTRWRPALQEEYVRKQGPWCPDLTDFLVERQSQFHGIVLFTYLYPTTYYAAKVVDPSRSVLVPTLHDEPAAYLDCYARAYGRVGKIVWNTEAERSFAARVWGLSRGVTLGLPIDVPEATAEDPGFPYVLYCGRIDEVKGCAELIDFFREYKRRHPGPLRLLLTGSLQIELPDDPDISYLGFVPEERKFALMKGAKAFIMPSRFESLSIVTLEAMGQGTPVLANRASAPVASHVQKTGCGDCYADREEFIAALHALVTCARASNDPRREAGRAYVRDNYGRASVRERLVEILETPALSKSCPPPESR